MKKTVGFFKGIIMLTMFFLIATRLTWLQTTDVPVDISSSFYKTGLWFNQNFKAECPFSPEATFPLPAAMAIRSDLLPPPPSLGQLSLGLALIMRGRCQFSRLEAEDFARWNAWLYMATTLSLAIFVRLLSRSWTAGMLSAVVVLSRGTVQGRAAFSSAEPFAMFFLANAWLCAVLFMRSTWVGWIFSSLLCLSCAVLFVPSLWLCFLGGAFLFVFLAISTTSKPNIPSAHGLIARKDPIAMTNAFGRDFWSFVGIFNVLILYLSYQLSRRVFFGPMINEEVLHINVLEITPEWLGGVVSTARELLIANLEDVDLHAIASLCLLVFGAFVGGSLKAVNKNIAISFVVIFAFQMVGSVWLEAVAIHSTFLASPAIASSARVYEPLLIAWGTGAAWRLVDNLTGNRLAISGWSIRTAR